MNELKPCPFCGRKAELGHTEKDAEYGETAFVYCTNCGAHGKMIKISPKYGADEKAIEAWNRRVNEDAPTADVVERKKGKWIPFLEEYHDMFKCSNCGNITRVPFKCPSPPYYYCPNCGADMRGEEK